MSRIMTFFAAIERRVLAFHDRLKKKRLYRVMMLYAVLIGALFKGAEFVFPAFRIDERWLQLLILGAVVGLPLVVIISLVVPYGNTGQYMPGLATMMVMMIVLVMGAVMAIAGEGPRRDDRAKTLAVLPFQTAGAFSETPHLAEDLHAALIAQLGRIRELRITSRRSAAAVRARDVRTVARRLGVGTVLEGMVRQVGERTRLEVELVDGTTAQVLWAKNFHFDPKAPDRVQRDIVLDIADALDVKLSFEERRNLRRRHVPDPLALEEYRTGLALERRGDPTLEQSLGIERLYRSAIRKDPEFALAYARLSRLSSRMWFAGLDRSPSRLREAEAAADTALALDPDLPEAHLALALVYYWGRRQYELAEKQLRPISEAVPSDPEIQATLGYISRRLGKWDQALAYLQRAAELDPLWADRFAEVAYTHRARREFAEADREFRRSFQADPSYHTVELERGELWYLWQGNTDTLVRVLARVPAGVDPEGEVTLNKFQIALLRRNPTAALRVVDSVTTGALDGQTYYYPRSLLRAVALRARGDSASAVPELRQALQELEAVVDEYPWNTWARISLARAYAAAGHREEAVRETQQALREESDQFFGPRMSYEAAVVYAESGMADAAIAELSRIITAPAGATAHQLRLDPAFDVLRGDPRFIALLES